MLESKGKLTIAVIWDVILAFIWSFTHLHPETEIALPRNFWSRISP